MSVGSHAGDPPKKPQPRKDVGLPEEVMGMLGAGSQHRWGPAWLQGSRLGWEGTGGGWNWTLTGQHCVWRVP